MNTFFLLFVLIFSTFFTACSTKKVYEPQSDVVAWENFSLIESDVVDFSSNVASLENGKTLAQNGILDVSLADGFRILSKSDSWIISSSIDGKLRLEDIDNRDIFKEIDLGKTIATASLDGDTLAILFADNEIALYSVETKEALFKAKAGDVAVVDTRITPPYFTRGLVIFSTLNAKVIIVNIEARKKLRSVTVSSEENFNNILFLDIVDKKVIAATTHKILSMTQDEIRKKYDIRNVASNGSSIYVTTKQGEVILLSSDLHENAKVKFPFAHFLGVIAKEDKIYMLEKEGYLIVAKSDLSSYDVYEVDTEDGSVFISDDKFYINDMAIATE